MSGWMHDDWTLAPACSECYAIEWESKDPKPCRIPTPDPTSPCGWEMAYAQGRCDLPDNRDEHRACDNPRCRHDGQRRGYNCHPYQPSRCTCGHPIRRVER